MADPLSMSADASTQLSSWAAGGGSGLGYYLLENIFGSQLLGYWGVSGSGVDGGPVSAAMGIAVSVALGIFPLIFAYIFIIGLLHTAEHGEVGGKQWSGMWAPARTVFGAVTVVPITPGGLSSIQLLVIGVALAGNYLGNYAASEITRASYVHGKSLLAPAIPASPSPDAMQKGFGGVVAIQTCQQTSEEMGFAIDEIARMCSAATVPAAGAASAATGLPGNGANVDSAGDCGGTKHTVVCRSIQQVNATVANKVSSILKRDGTISDEQLGQLRREYDQGIQNAVKKNLSGDYRSENAAKSINSLGWPGMGLWFVRLAAAQSEFNSYITKSSGSFDPSKIPAMSDPGYNVYAATSRAWETESGPRAAFDAARHAVHDSAAGFGRLAVDGEVWVFNKLTEGNPPMEQLMDMGHIVELFGIAIMSAGAVADGIGGSGEKAGVAGGAGKVISAISGLIKGIGKYIASLGMLLFGLGFIMTSILPALPAIYVGYMAIEWVIWVAIASIASPLWTLLHMVPEGEGLIHHGAERGWKMLAFLLLFPVFVMIGYAVGIMVFNVAVPMMAQIIWGLVPDGALSSLGDILAKPLMVGATMTIVGYVSLGLIHKMPYQIADWLGIGVSGGFTTEAAGHEQRPGPTVIPTMPGKSGGTPGIGGGKKGAPSPGGAKA